MSESLLLLFTKEQPWVNRYLCSFKKSDMSNLLVIRANRFQKQMIHLKKIIFFVCLWQFFTVFPLFMPKSKSLLSLFTPSLFLNSNGSNGSNLVLFLFVSHREQITLYKRAIVSDSLMSLFTKEKWEQVALFPLWIALLLTKNEWLARKTEKQIPIPANEPVYSNM